jgi:hypothetical protein
MSKTALLDTFQALSLKWLFSIRKKRYSLSVKHSRQLRRFLAMLAPCLWVATASFTEHVSAQFPLCVPAQSPCCPQPTNDTSESCPACHVTVTVAAKQAGYLERLNSFSRAQGALRRRPRATVIASRRELSPGLHFRAAVFDLKDDLRI